MSMLTSGLRVQRGWYLSRLIRLALWLLSGLLQVWAWADPIFRDTEGVLQKEFCLLVAVSVALLIVGYGVGKRLQQCAYWSALALVGQAVALQMIDAGSLIHYQHYRPLASLITGQYVWLLIALTVQTSFVIAGFRSRWSHIHPWISQTFKPWQLLGIGLVFFLSSAAMSREVPVYLVELFFATFVQAVNLGNIVLVVWALPTGALAALQQKCEKLFGLSRKEEKGKSSGLERYAVLAAVWVTCLAATLSFFVYERHPHIQDEVIYLYQARYFANGTLTVPAPRVPEAFSIYMIPQASDRWYSIFPPGWAALLALGVFLGVAWLVNPVLAGLNVLLTYVLVRWLYSRRTARMVVLLLCVSPWHVFMAMNFMAHTLTLTGALAAAVTVAWARTTGKAMWAGLGGFVAGMVSLIRPLDGLAMAGLLGLWIIGIGGWRLKISSIAVFCLGAVVAGSAILPYNNILTGDPTVSPLTAYYEKYFGPKTNALGFGPERGLGWAIDPFPGHSPFEALINAMLNTFSVNIELLGWSTGSLILVALLVFSGAMQKTDYLMLIVIATIFGAYSLYWFNGGPDFGARYWYLMLVPLIVLTVRGLQFLERGFESSSASSTHRGNPAVVAVLCLCVCTLVNYLPWRAIDKYYHYLRMRPDIRLLAEEYRFGKSLVFIRGESHPDYESAWVYNPPERLDRSTNVPVYAFDRNTEVRSQILDAYQDRPVWLIDGPSITHGAFKVIEGPLSVQEVKSKIGREK